MEAGLLQRPHRPTALAAATLSSSTGAAGNGVPLPPSLPPPPRRVPAAAAPAAAAAPPSASKTTASATAPLSTPHIPGGERGPQLLSLDPYLAPESHPWFRRIDVKEDRLVHRRYMAMYDRSVQFTSTTGQSHTVQYDVVGNPHLDFRFSVAFPFHPATATSPAQVTLVREYAQGPNALMFTLPCGGFDPRRHTSLRHCAIAEMREEAMLVGGEVVDLLPEDHPGQSELKWSRNKFKPFLFINPRFDPSGCASRDEEELTIEVVRVTIPELYGIILGGQMMLPSVFATFLALEALKARKLLAC
ncbi:hypothetical protein HYH02_003763 [Chlamydomonas schloesseri]|uniref:Nudix hydrolase domain-containing protein n=1 Tax=Chlamydomonas schloesseri TaxID=2026947 RepID=A0A835WQE5_9CHLO|nr:hypothetical protein HYH02_003763 [Chlamydomonas schloesseri]|eukprot:KAG2451992.1 hypothetical protein HYH02_003763 [Chlamydomonas schloesseri]